MDTNANKYKRNFAEFQAKFDAESYEINKAKKQELFSEVKGNVLEIGPGTGVNFVFLKTHPIKWMGIEPNLAMHSYLFDAAKANDIKASLLDCTSEKICLPDNTLDYVISSEVLCSVTNLDESISEIKRVLRANGKFLFIEHVIDKHNLIRKVVQKTVPHTPWKCFSDGCNPGRDIGSAIENSGFSKVEYTNYMQNGKGIINMINKPHIYGWALK